MADIPERDYGTANDWYLYIALNLFQAVLWGWLYHKERSPLRAALHANLERDELKKENLQKNGHDGGSWSFWMVVTLHHSLGGFIGLAGLLSPVQSWSVLLVRIGLSFEIGEDFLHYFQMAQACCYPPGPELFGVLFPTKVAWVGIACHHAVGAVAGSFVFIYIPYVSGAQFCCVLLLISTVPQGLTNPFLPYINLRAREVSCLGQFVALLTFSGILVASWARIFLFPPAVFDLLPFVAENYGQGIANVLLGACSFFMVFVFAGLIMALGDLKAAFKTMLGYGTTEEGEEETKVAIALGAAQTSFMLISRSHRSSQRSIKLSAQQEMASPTNA